MLLSVAGGVPSYQDFKSSGSSGPPTSPPHLTMPVHPDVHFKRLPFYDVLKELLKPSSLGVFLIPKFATGTSFDTQILFAIILIIQI